MISSSSSFRIDSSDFDRGMLKANAAGHRGVLRGLGLAGEAWMNDAIGDIPEAAEDTGALKSSATVHVDNKLFRISKDVWTGHSAWGSKERPTPYRGYLTDRNGRGNTATVMFNKSYAGQWHERFPKSGAFQSKRAGIKYLENKMYTHGAIYLNIVKLELQKALGMT